MNLQDYLSAHFFTRTQLLDAAAVPEERFGTWQEAGVMPKPSYVVKTALACRSFFGEHEESFETEYYARRYVEWLELLRTTSEPSAVAGIFRARYRAALERLFAQGFASASTTFTTGLDGHLAEEWSGFLDGTYGLCTRSGLPEEIAAKELATAIIKEMLVDVGQAGADAAFRERLRAAVDLLDANSSAFAPHERARSSRRRLVDDVRATYLSKS